MYDRRVLTTNRALQRASQKDEKQMKKLLTLTLLLCLFTTGAMAQTTTSTQTGTKQGAKRGPIFRATKEQINQAQAILKSRGFYSGEQIGKLDDATREGVVEAASARAVLLANPSLIKRPVVNWGAGRDVTTGFDATGWKSHAL
jgi:hypothetical protein